MVSADISSQVPRRDFLVKVLGSGRVWQGSNLQSAKTELIYYMMFAGQTATYFAFPRLRKRVRVRVTHAVNGY